MEQIQESKVNKIKTKEHFKQYKASPEKVENPDNEIDYKIRCNNRV